jgi:hypothetical protein
MHVDTSNPEMRDEGRVRRRVAAALVLLAIGFLLLVPDPHDHGDAGSLGGLFRLLLPGSTAHGDPQKAQGTPRAGQQGICPVHFWQQVAGTGLLLAFLLGVLLRSELRVLFTVALPSTTPLVSFQIRAPPLPL